MKKISLDDLYRRDAGLCRIGSHSIRRDEATRDHIRPKAAGGGDEAHNIQLACEPCNVAKGHQFEGYEHPVSRKKLKVPKSRWDFLPEYGPVAAQFRSVL